MEGIDETPLPLGMAWNMVYDLQAKPGELAPISSEQLWDRLGRFLKEIIPVAEEAGVVMAAHPDDPPAATMRRTPRLVYTPALYQRLLDAVPSPSNALEFCVGTIAEMADGDVYEATDRYSGQGKLAYVHLRNVRGKVPRYHETFIDEGDIDMQRLLGVLKKNRYDGILIPDHTPLPGMRCPVARGDGVRPGLHPRPPAGDRRLRLTPRSAQRPSLRGACLYLSLNTICVGLTKRSATTRHTMVVRK